MSNRLVLGDANIRALLRTRLLVEHAGDSDTALIEELGLCRGQVRVDVSVVNGLMHGYEIKSDQDRLSRLSSQAGVYGRVLDLATLVVGDRHLQKALQIVPRWWGVLKVNAISERFQFQTIRQPRPNPDRDPRALVELLWLDEAIALLKERDALRGFRGKARRIVWDRVCELYHTDEIAAAVRKNLKARARMQALA